MLQQHALPTVEAYGYTTETLLRALDMDEFLPGPVGAPAKLLGGPRVSRRAIRAGRCLFCTLLAQQSEQGCLDPGNAPVGLELLQDLATSQRP